MPSANKLFTFIHFTRDVNMTSTLDKLK